MQAVIGALGGLSAMAVAAIGYRQWSKGHDGTVNRSEATELWDHFNAFQDRQDRALERALSVEDELRAKITSLETEQASMRHAIDDKNDQIAEMAAQIVGLRKAREEMEVDLSDNADQIAALTTHLNEALARIATLEEERDGLIAERDALIEQLSRTGRMYQ